MSTLRWAVAPTPLGLGLFIQSNGASITFSEFRRAQPIGASDPVLKEAAKQVRAYFARRLEVFTLPLDLEQGTAFERDVWRAVSQLHFGYFASYAEVARAVGRPRSHRGVAAAMRRTRIDLFIPAHRILGADRRLKGCGPRSIRARLAAFEGLGSRGGTA